MRNTSSTREQESNVDTFSKGKKGTPRTGMEILVMRLNTWSTKTLLQHIRKHGRNPESLTNRQTLIVQLAKAMIDDDQDAPTSL
jgi:hypothetical protein